MTGLIPEIDARDVVVRDILRAGPSLPCIPEGTACRVHADAQGLFVHCMGHDSGEQTAALTHKHYLDNDIVRRDTRDVIVGFDKCWGARLWFAGEAAIAAADPRDREAYYRAVDKIANDPSLIGCRYEDSRDIEEDDRIDNRLAAEQREWTR